MTKPEEFKILSPREHVRTRMNVYLGAESLSEIDRVVLGKNRKLTYVPAINKAIDEIIDNSVDEAIRTKFKYANVISVTIDGNRVTVQDNGRGIPQDLVTDMNTGKEMIRPQAAWCLLNAGTSFTADRETIGANGVGSSCVNFISQEFHGQTWRDGKCISVKCEDGTNRIDVTTHGKIAQPGTSVSFVLDFSLFDVDSLDEHDTLLLVEDRLTNLQIAFPEIKFLYNAKHVKTKTLKDLAKLVADEASTVVHQKDDIAFMISASEEGFVHNSFANGVNTRQGGAYVGWLSDGIADALITQIKKKHKIDVTRSLVKDGLQLILFARRFTDAKYDSQTKERLTNTPGVVAKHYTSAGGPDVAIVAKQILNTPNIIDPIIEAQLAKKLAADRRAETLAAKKIKRVKVAKHISATDPSATLFLMEGDSAISSFLRVRDPEKAGAFPLRGVVLNTWEKKPIEILNKNKELTELIAILGIDIRDPESIVGMNYDKIAILTDADHDGAHISTLLIGFFYKFWPKLFEEGKIFLARSPMQISSKGKNKKWFYGYDDAEKFKQENPQWSHQYIKGLAQLDEDEYDVVINKPTLDRIEIDDLAYMKIMLTGCQERKDFLTMPV